jgi:secondary thiamine-phosphate synthase enzyme
VPQRETYYRHAEGNSDSHVKATMVGSSVTVLIEAGKLVLGRWQGVYFCEFDGPRQRELYVKPVKFAPPESD